MPQLIACIECSKRIRVPDDMIGKRIKCPNCGATFIMLFLHMMALMLVLLANILVLFRTRTTLQKAARA